jgi:predicted nucleotidyltransferase
VTVLPGTRSVGDAGFAAGLAFFGFLVSRPPLFLSLAIPTSFVGSVARHREHARRAGDDLQGMIASLREGACRGRTANLLWDTLGGGSMSSTKLTLHGIAFPMETIAELCRRYQVRELALFGSILRDDFRPDSDIDVLVEFEPGAEIDLIDYQRFRSPSRS